MENFFFTWRNITIVIHVMMLIMDHNTYGRLFAYIHSGFVILTFYHLMQDYIPNDQPFYINIVISFILAAALFYYSRKTE